MKRCVALLLLLINSSVSAQTVDWMEYFQNQSVSKFAVSIQSEVLRNRFDASSYLASKVMLQYQVGLWRAQATLNNNYEQAFQFEPEPITVSLPQNVSLTRPLNLPNDAYRFNFPLSFSLGLSGDQVGVSAFFAVLTEKVMTSKVQIVEQQGGSFSAKIEPVDAERQTILAGLRSYAALGNLHLHLGVMPAPILNFGSTEMPFSYRSDILPFSEVEFIQPYFRFGLSAHLRSIGAFYVHSLPNPLPNIAEPIQISLRAQRSISKFNFQTLQFDIGIPLTSDLAASIGVERVWYSSDQFSRSEFQKWLNAATLNWTNSANNLLQEQAFRVGATFKFGTEVPPVLKLADIKLLHRNIFQSKREYYAHNPVAILTLHNADKRPVWCQVVATLGNTGRFRSEPIQINADELLDVPVYLYVSDVKQFQLSRLGELSISIESDNRKVPLASMPITILNENAWDGDTWSLKFFIAPNDPQVQLFAKTKYLRALMRDSTLQPAKFYQLKHFIDELGKDLRYVPDATTTMIVDQVQSPRETLEKRSGDCEDLVVYLASCLMSVGIQCAIIDVRPKTAQNFAIPTAEPGAIGHLFLLVDTGLDATRLGELGLTEFEAISRQNALGKTTLWLPIETTVLQSGFEVALKTGAQQYYREVVEKQGVVKGNVHIYDF